MKASELIKLIQWEIDLHGDLDVVFFEGTTPDEKRDVFYQNKHSQTWHNGTTTTYPQAIMIRAL
jgi:hypothetical protein